MISLTKAAERLGIRVGSAKSLILRGILAAMQIVPALGLTPRPLTLTALDTWPRKATPPRPIPRTRCRQADNYYAHDTNAAQYLFVYGGSGAGYLLYNGDCGGNAPDRGMILGGADRESSLNADHVVANNFFDPRLPKLREQPARPGGLCLVAVRRARSQHRRKS